MKPTQLTARNFRTYPEIDMQFPDGLVAIVGELRGMAAGADSNGAGKSSILEAVDIALFGRRTLAPFLTRGLIDEELLLELELEHAGSVYRIRRTYSPRGRGRTTLDFEQQVDGEWVPLTAASIKDTDQLISRTIGLTRDTYRNSSYLRQGDGSFADPSRDPRERRDLLAAAVFGHDPVWPRLLDRARGEKRTLEASLEKLDGRAQAARETVAEKPAVAARRAEVVEVAIGVADTVADVEREHAALAERYQQAREQAARAQAAEAELREASAACAALEQREATAAAAERAIADAVEQCLALPAAGDTVALEQREAGLAGQIEERGRQSHERELLLRSHDEAVKRRDELWLAVEETDEAGAAVRAKIADTTAQPDATCETCGQHLDDAARKQTIAAYTAELERHLATGAALAAEARAIVLPVVPAEPPPAPTAELGEVREQLRAVREAAATRAKLEERIRQNEPAAAARPTAEEMTRAYEVLGAKAAAVNLVEADDLDEIARWGATVRARLDAARGQLEQQRTLKARLDERLAQIGEAEQQLGEAAKERARLQDTLAVVAQLERAYGPSGIPTLILENVALPAIEAEANRILAALGCPLQIELRTQAEKKDGTGLKETLEVVVVDQQGDEAPFEECTSGGEKTRIGLALRIAVARLLRHRSGAESRILCLDEPSYLDEAGMRALLTVLAELQADFDTILLVSHVAELRDSFDTTLQVVRDGATSRIEGVGVFEAAVA